MTEWRLKRVSDSSIEDALFDVEVTDAVNRFGRRALAYIDDHDDEKWPEYPRGTALEFEYSTDGGSTWTRRFAGFVVERRERDNAGADELELDVYSYDHFLRRQSVTRSFSGKTITDSLKEIIEDFTPVSWVAGNVDVVNDTTLSRDFDGEKVDNVIAELASKSANEEFGVNDDIEFFFQPRETTQAPRGIDNSQWFKYDIPETGKEAVNEVELFYGDSGNEGSVRVTDGADKLELQDSIGTAGPVVFREEVTRPEIDTASDARDKAQEILNDRSSTLTGTVTTFDLYGAEPGQVIPVQIDPREIDTEFRIAQLDYRWGSDETDVTIVENQGAQSEKLVRITDTLKRVEQRAADRSAATTVYEGPLESRELFQITATVTVRAYGDGRFNPGFGRDELGFGRSEVGIHIASVSTVTEASSRATDELRNAVRAGWKDDSPPSITTLSVGSGDASPSRTDTALDTAEYTEAASVATPSATMARFVASGRAPQDVTIRELGLEADDSTLYVRLSTGDQDVSENAPVDFEISIETADDPDAQGVITTNGSTVTRDIVADNSPDPPTQFVFGEDNTTPTVGDTSLGTAFKTVSIDSFSDRETGVLDVVGDVTNSSGSSVTLREWGLKNASGDLLSRIVYADIILEDTESLNATQRLGWVNE